MPTSLSRLPFFLAVALSTAMIACSDKDSDDDGDGDGGSDGGAAHDGGSAGTYDTGLFVFNYEGTATVSPGMSWDGVEVAYAHGLGPDLWCEITTTTASTTPNTTCTDCTFAFDIDFTGSQITSDVGCDLVGMTDPSLYDGAYSYGLIEDYYYGSYGPYDLLMLGYQGKWYWAGEGSFDGSSFDYKFWYDYYYYVYYLY
ncbi:MAG: hypothetical protein D6798_21015 [Deltaproteobacteria bacterium]|nr:MAG: hypothetical protein D6798_21015 [Deltaproteobacteria bacterium]